VSESPPRRFTVGTSAAQRELLKTEAARAIANGLAAEFVAALKEIEFRLTIEPNDWGESRERLPALRIQMRCGTNRMITVLYGVAEDRDVVFVREYRVNRNWKPPFPSS
jgi:hypothetical protein